jgi:transglutaminase-like putative cysteine protease
MKRPPDPEKPSPALGAAAIALKALWTAFVIATPVLGAWLASSLAAHANGPVALAAASGLLAFPTLPLAWEAWASYRRKKAKAPRPRILTFTDRLILRTLALNLLFLAILLATRPQAAFTALSTRGDWMLDGNTGMTADSIRKRLFWAADRLEWLYLAVRTNPFDQKNGDSGSTADPTSGSSATPTPTSSATPTPTSSATPTPTNSATPTPTDKPASDNPAPDKPASDNPAPDKPASDKPAPDKPASDKPAPDKPASDTPRSSIAWPAPATLHPVVASMPADAEQSIASVARYIAERESDEVGRFRAAHDWVADRIAYDGPSYVAHKYPPQDAQTVFRTRTSVCAGYAQLLTALGKALGLDVVYVVGDARTTGTGENGDGHAWSAVKLGGRYYLADATWDSGTLDGATFKKRFTTDYLFTPPEVFGVDHFPDDKKWQLRDKPISRGDFFRQPMMASRFYAEGRELLSPLRSQVTVPGPLTAEIKTRSGLYTLATWTLGRGTEQTHCQVTNGEITRVTCDLPGKGSYLVRLFSGPQPYGHFDFIGQIEANRE